MKQYKLIKEYPGSSKLGTLAIYRDSCKDYFIDSDYHQSQPTNNIENQLEFWEEIIEKD